MWWLCFGTKVSFELSLTALLFWKGSALKCVIPWKMRMLRTAVCFWGPAQRGRDTLQSCTSVSRSRKCWELCTLAAIHKAQQKDCGFCRLKKSVRCSCCTGVHFSCLSSYGAIFYCSSAKQCRRFFFKINYFWALLHLNKYCYSHSRNTLSSSFLFVTTFFEGEKNTCFRPDSVKI